MRRHLFGVIAFWIFVAGTACDMPMPPNACGGPLAAGTDADCRIVFDGRAREFFIHVPDSYTGSPLPLILDLHGTGSSREGQRDLSGWIELSEREGLIIVHPEALPGITGRTQWNAGDCCEEGQQADDEGFLREAVRITRAAVEVDSAQIFATGLSTGGVMSHFLGCRAADVFSAIAPISFQLSSTLTCEPARPLSMIEFHAPTDRQRPANGHVVTLPSGARTRFPSAFDSAARWGEINGCAAQPRTSFASGGSRCVEFPDCRRARVMFCAIDGAGQVLGGHVLYDNNDSLDLAEISWSFFESIP